MIKVGLVGEDPNDTRSVANLLGQNFSERVQFYPLLKGIKGNQLDTKKVMNALPIEAESKRCKFVVYIRDLDGLPSETKKIQSRVNWFKKLDAKVNSMGLLLLNIWELEALILADIDTFNRIYGVKHKFKGNPSFQRNPKEELKRITKNSKRKYLESDCPEVFGKLKYAVVKKQCAIFGDFVDKFDNTLKKRKTQK